MTASIKEKIWGSFAGVAIGDGMGMPFHELTSEEIYNRCGGLANKFYNIFPDEFIHLNYSAGQTTDDTALTIVTANAILKYQGEITPDQFLVELNHWAEQNKAVWQHGKVYGPTTRANFENYLSGKFAAYKNKERNWVYTGTSNGAIMRVSPAGWANPGNWEKAVELACNVILPTHSTEVAISAAASQAAAISEALTEGADYLSVIDHALIGAEAGEKLGKQVARITGQRYPYENLQLGLELAEKARDALEAGNLIRRTIGSHFHVSETLAMAFGIFYAAKGDFESAVIAGVNSGGDTDTIASIIGALCGALSGIKVVPEEWLQKVEEVNQLDCELMASRFCDMLCEFE